MADYIKLPEVARRLGVSEKTARRMVKAGKLPAVFFGNAYRVTEEDLAEYLERAKVLPGKARAPSSQEALFNGISDKERRALETFDDFCDQMQAIISIIDKPSPLTNLDTAMTRLFASSCVHMAEVMPAVGERENVREAMRPIAVRFARLGREFIEIVERKNINLAGEDEDAQPRPPRLQVVKDSFQEFARAS